VHRLWLGLAVSAVVIGSAPTAVASAADTWSGTWSRAEDGVAGNLILEQAGTSVTGHYTWNDGSGQVNGQAPGTGTTFSGGFNETHYQGSFSLSLSGTHFTGSYSGTNKDTQQSISGPFDGTCIAGPCLSNGAAPTIAIAQTPSRFDSPVSVVAPPPGGEAAVASPQLGNASTLTATETGVAPDDLVFAAALLNAKRQYCYVESIKGLSEAIAPFHSVLRPGKIDTIAYINDLENAGDGLFTDVAACMASADTMGKVLDRLSTPAAARSYASSACRSLPLTLTTSKKQVRKVGAGGLKALSVKCTLKSGLLKLRVASTSGKPLRKLVGSRLFLGIRRSQHDSAGGQLGFSFHKG
jgi:hypothetical protein